MMSLMPYYTTRPAAAMMRSIFDDPFFSPFLSVRTPERKVRSMMRVDVEDTGDSYLLTADLPGMRREDIRLSVEDGVMTIAAEYDHTPAVEPEEGADRRYLYQERRSGSMSRSFSIEGVKEEDIHAEYADGVLHVTLPKMTVPEKNPVRQIEIH